MANQASTPPSLPTNLQIPQYPSKLHPLKRQLSPPGTVSYMRQENQYKQDDSFFLKEIPTSTYYNCDNNSQLSLKLKLQQPQPHQINLNHPNRASELNERLRCLQDVSRNTSLIDNDILKMSTNLLNMTQASVGFAKFVNSTGFNTKVVLSSRQSTTLKMLNDREKFILAKNNNYVDVLLELIHSNDQLSNGRSSSFLIDSNNSLSIKYQQNKRQQQNEWNNLQKPNYAHMRNSSGNNQSVRLSGLGQNDSEFLNPKGNQGVTQLGGNIISNPLMTSTLSANNSQSPNEMRSNLKKEWMQSESLVSHSALNQLSYILIQKKKEVKLHVYYNTDLQFEKQKEKIQLRKQIINNLENQKSIEKRIQRYLLMADDTGVQASLYLLLMLSDDELKGLLTNDIPPDHRSSLTSLHSPVVHDKQSVLSSTSKFKNKIDQNNAKMLKKNYKTDWFRKACPSLIDSLEHILGDSSFSMNTIRILILLLGNLYQLNKPQTKAYVAKKTTYLRFKTFFNQERSNMSEEELIELENVLKKFYSHRDLYGLTMRQKQIQRIKDVYYQQNNLSQSKEGKQPSQLIRQDSLESLIEMVQQEATQNSMLFDLNNQSRKSDDKSGKVVYTFSQRKTESLGPESQIHYAGSQERISKLALIGAPKRPSNQGQEEYYTFGQQFEPLRMKFQNSGGYLSPDQSHQSKERGALVPKLLEQSYNQYYCQTLESQTKGTPLDQTFIDMKESMLVKERSFHMKHRGDQSHDDSQFGTNSNGISPRISKGKKNNPNMKSSEAKLQHDRKRQKHDQNGSQMNESQQLNIRKHTQTDEDPAMLLKSTHFNTKLTASGHKNVISLHQNDFNQRSNNNYHHHQNEIQVGCCFGLSLRSSQKKKRRKTENEKDLHKNDKGNHKKASNVKQKQEQPLKNLDHELMMFSEKQILGMSSHSDNDKQDRLLSTGSSIKSSEKGQKCAQHNIPLKQCAKCNNQIYEHQRQAQKEKISDCSIF